MFGLSRFWSMACFFLGIFLFGVFEGAGRYLGFRESLGFLGCIATAGVWVAGIALLGAWDNSRKIDIEKKRREELLSRPK